VLLPLMALHRSHDRRRTLFAALTAALAVGLAACGGGKPTAPESPAPVDTTTPPPPAPVASVTIDAAATTLPLYHGLSLFATVRDSLGNVLQGRAITWSSDQPSIAAVTGAGAGATITTLAPGTATIRATAGGKAGTATVTITSPVEARALWVNRFEYTTASSADAAKIALIMQNAAKANFNIVYFQVRTAGDALYASDIEPCSPRLCGTLGGTRPFDPLALAITEAAKYDIQVHAWLNSLTGWISGSTAACGQLVESTPRHMLLEHPSWAMLDASGSPQVCGTATPEYIWVSPGVPGVRHRLAHVAADIARRYAVSGIHLDRIRYPSNTLSWDTASVNAYSRTHGSAPVAGSVAWADFRRAFVNDAVRAVADSIRAVNPALVLSAAVWPVYKTMPGWSSSKGFDDYLQDPRAWAAAGALDVAVPMTYPASATSTSYIVKDALCSNLDWVCLLNDHRLGIESAAGRHVYIGVGAIKGWAEVQKQLIKGREQLATGYSFYSYSQVDAFDGWTQLSNSYFKYPAIIPPMSWK
jgi:uncharacterized lipoprotein YddW (UPF0748 family)